ncbi:phosphogluconate dehydrogenase (NAD(+)-dependent, decarboxylating) [Bacillus sp. FJAT-26390]|uniref:phosphogluconate dehydrogenase (NAD(+)-dependent, decarboxylating) n=1 Tax=Bacillus sp. FJAT-26390 TaxID=1743142 RepID=UPI000808060A|nr:decarboxylating 6-phosphogluconate dehydrogenase [Bacillus sp. FJAT-26390]OBZ08140.1 6-phosphogluconate dehydrogenase (decarboxylating) [Bacillus sp. FJAT-26390]
MQIGIIGLGKMGYNLMLNVLEHNHKAVVYDVNTAAIEKAEEDGAQGASSIKQLVQSLSAPRVIWMMVPAGELTEAVIQEAGEALESGDILIDGGNSNYKDTTRRAEKLAEQGIHFLDVGTSGGTSGARSGACTMIGGNKAAFESVEQLFKDICVADGYLHAGESGSGHFLKMVHNGVEYGMMQAIAEGFELLEKSAYDFDFEKVARVWNNGSVIRSWLMELTENAFAKDAKLDGLKGIMHSSGEGKWTLETALDLQTATPVIALSLLMRYRSLEENTFSGKVVAALRNEFGGHSVVSS